MPHASPCRDHSAGVHLQLSVLTDKARSEHSPILRYQSAALAAGSYSNAAFQKPCGELALYVDSYQALR